MNDADRQLILENILMQCHVAPRKGVAFEAIVAWLLRTKYQVTANEVDAEIRYLEDNKYIREVTHTLLPEQRRYVATSDGTNHLRREGLL